MNQSRSRRLVEVVLLGAGVCLLAGPSFVSVAAQDTPNRREFTITARDFRFSPARVEVSQDDLVKLTVQSEDIAYSLTIDEYRVSRRVPAGGSTTFEFRTDRAGVFIYYSNLTSDRRHSQARGELVVRPR
jgi:heme/copper-type cytochrome/quinol oxidase subunit 2